MVAPNYGAQVKAGLIPALKSTKEAYLSEASASLRRWQAVIGELTRAEEIAPDLTQEKRSINDTLVYLQAMEREIDANLDVLRVADKALWRKTQGEIQRDFMAMKRKFDALSDG